MGSNSNCDSVDSLDQYERFVARELPILLRRMLEQDLDQNDHLTKGRVIDIVEAAQAKLLHQFRATRHSGPNASRQASLRPEDPKPPEGEQLHSPAMPLTSTFSPLHIAPEMLQFDNVYDSYLGHNGGETTWGMNSEEQSLWPELLGRSEPAFSGV